MVMDYEAEPCLPVPTNALDEANNVEASDVEVNEATDVEEQAMEEAEMELRIHDGNGSHDRDQIGMPPSVGPPERLFLQSSQHTHSSREQSPKRLKRGEESSTVAPFILDLTWIDPFHEIAERPRGRIEVNSSAEIQVIQELSTLASSEDVLKVLSTPANDKSNSHIERDNQILLHS